MFIFYILSNLCYKFCYADDVTYSACDDNLTYLNKDNFTKCYNYSDQGDLSFKFVIDMDSNNSLELSKFSANITKIYVYSENKTVLLRSKNSDIINIEFRCSGSVLKLLTNIYVLNTYFSNIYIISKWYRLSTIKLLTDICIFINNYIKDIVDAKDLILYIESNTQIQQKNISLSDIVNVDEINTLTLYGFTEKTTLEIYYDRIDVILDNSSFLLSLDSSSLKYKLSFGDKSTTYSSLTVFVFSGSGYPFFLKNLVIEVSDDTTVILPQTIYFGLLNISILGSISILQNTEYFIYNQAYGKDISLELYLATSNSTIDNFSFLSDFYVSGLEPNSNKVFKFNNPTFPVQDIKIVLQENSHIIFNNFTTTSNSININQDIPVSINNAHLYGKTTFSFMQMIMNKDDVIYINIDGDLVDTPFIDINKLFYSSGAQLYANIASNVSLNEIEILCFAESDVNCDDIKIQYHNTNYNKNSSYKESCITKETKTCLTLKRSKSVYSDDICLEDNGTFCLDNSTRINDPTKITDYLVDDKYSKIRISSDFATVSINLKDLPKANLEFVCEDIDSENYSSKIKVYLENTGNGHYNMSFWNCELESGENVTFSYLFTDLNLSSEDHITINTFSTILNLYSVLPESKFYEIHFDQLIESITLCDNNFSVSFSGVGEAHYPIKEGSKVVFFINYNITLYGALKYTEYTFQSDDPVMYSISGSISNSPLVDFQGKSDLYFYIMDSNVVSFDSYSPNRYFNFSCCHLDVYIRNLTVKSEEDIHINPSFKILKADFIHVYNFTQLPFEEIHSHNIVLPSQCIYNLSIFINCTHLNISHLTTLILNKTPEISVINALGSLQTLPYIEFKAGLKKDAYYNFIYDQSIDDYMSEYYQKYKDNMVRFLTLEKRYRININASEKWFHYKLVDDSYYFVPRKSTPTPSSIPITIAPPTSTYSPSSNPRTKKTTDAIAIILPSLLVLIIACVVVIYTLRNKKSGVYRSLLAESKLLSSAKFT